MYEFKEVANIDEEKLRKLFLDAGWKSYVENIEKVLRGIENSLISYAAWDREILIGFVRAVGDGENIVYIQDLVVLDSYKRRGLGKKLINIILDKYIHVRQKVLITDNNPEATGFYKSMGFEMADNKGIVAFIKFD